MIISILLERKKEKGRWHFLRIWTYPTAKREKADRCSRRGWLLKFSPKKMHIPPSNSYKIQISPSIFHKIQMLHFTLDGKGFISGMWVRKGGGENALTMLFWSYLVRMDIFLSDILEPPRCHVSMCCCLDAIKGTALRWEKGSYAHLLTCCYCCWVF